MSVYPPPFLSDFTRRQNGMTNEYQQAMISLDKATLQHNHDRANKAHALDVRKRFNAIKHRGSSTDDDNINRLMAETMGIEYTTNHIGPTYRPRVYEEKQDTVFMERKHDNDMRKAAQEIRQNTNSIAAEHWRHQKENSIMQAREIKAIMARQRAEELKLSQSVVSELEYKSKHQTVLEYTKKMIAEEAETVKHRNNTFEQQEKKHREAFHKAEQLHQKMYKTED